MKEIKVVAGIFRKNGKVLIARRKSGKSLAGYWEFPGGKIDEDETPEDALIRELHEELRIKISIEGHFRDTIYPYDDFIVHLSAFLVSTSEVIHTSSDHDALEWIDTSEYSNYQIAPADIPIIIALSEF